MSDHYLYNIEYTVDDFDLWTFPDDLQNPEDLATIVRFTMKPSVCLEIGDDEFIDQINCDKKVVKNTMFSLSDDNLRSEIDGKITVYKLKSKENENKVGAYKLVKLQDKFKRLAEEFDKQSEKKEGKCGSKNKCVNQPTFEVVKEIVQLLNKECLPCGSLYYTLRLTCFGPSITGGDKTDISCNGSKVSNKEFKCLERALTPSPCQPKPCGKKSEYDEYAAEVNGNQLIIRVHKEDHSYLVTRVFDSNMDQNGNEMPRNDNIVSVCGCEQQIDFKFLGKFSCGDCKPKCDSTMTDYQRKTSCAGTSFKNSRGLPVIRGNLKYPGRLDGSIKLDVYDKCNSRDVTEKYKMKPMNTRGVCCQADNYNIERELQGNPKIPRGIEVCKKGCDQDSDVFILKIGRKNVNKNGKQNAIELEMRTPKGPDNEIKKMETREIQVDEKEFEEKTKTLEKKTDANPSKGVVKKTEVKPTKGFTSKKK